MAWSTSDRRAELPPDWDARRAIVLNRDGWACQVRGPGCLRNATEVDHALHPLDHRIGSLQAVCRECHRVKTLAESMAGRRRRARPAEPHPGIIDPGARPG